jgi:hypothetical protein
MRSEPFLKRFTSNPVHYQADAVLLSLLESAIHTHLESPRFDRIGMQGKRRVVAIDALHSEFIGAHSSRRTWIYNGKTLAKKKMIPHDNLRLIASIYAFGLRRVNGRLSFGTKGRNWMRLIRH